MQIAHSAVVEDSAEPAIRGRVLSGSAGLSALGATSGAATPFQSQAWIAAYLGGTGKAESFRLIELAGKDGRMLLPVMLVRHAGLITADIVGEKHASFHAPVLEGGAAQWSPDVVRQALIAAGRLAGIDAFTFRDCPFEVHGSRNPLSALEWRKSPSFGARLTLERNIDLLLERISDKEDRRKVRSKERKLGELGPLVGKWASDVSEIRAALDALMLWKAQRFQAQGIANPFKAAGVAEFLAKAASGPEPAIRIFALHAGETPLAIMAGAVWQGQFSSMANANSSDETILKASPGYILILHLIRQLVADGYESFDLGVGEAAYKTHYCPETIPLFDLAVPVTPAGAIAAALFRSGRGIKGKIKRDRDAMAFIRRIRLGLSRSA